MTNQSRFEILADLIRERKTTKVFGLAESPLHLTADIAQHWNEQVRQVIEAAGPAPFHFARNVDGVAEPWRVTTLWWEACRNLAVELPQLCPDLKPGNKLPAILSACGAAVLVHWLPAGADEIAETAKREETNFEHLAAASAFVQNLLLLLTAAGLESYWASANLLDRSEVKLRLGVQPLQKLLGAIMVSFPLPAIALLERAGGGNRSKRSPAANWSRELERLS
jgi:nitroreductase